jgi:hypothetical protein
MKAKNNGANVTIISFDDGREICLSYGVPVAAFIPLADSGTPGRPAQQVRGYVKSAAKYSATTSKHATQYAGKDATVIPFEQFAALVAPLEIRPSR